MSYLVYCFLGSLVSQSNAYPATISNFSTGQDIVDLTYPFDENTIYWPEVEQAGQKFRRDPEEMGKAGEKPGVMYGQGQFKAGEHGGTHMDAPLHFNRQGLDTADLSMDQQSGPACSGRRGSQMRKEPRLPNEPERHPDLREASRPNRERIFRDYEVRLGLSISQQRKILQQRRRQHLQHFVPSFPGWHWDAVDWLIKNRDIRGVGSDASSTDNARDNEGPFRTHLMLGENGRIGLEYVANVDVLPPKGAQIMVVPMKIAAGTGAPTRMLAILPPKMRVSPGEFGVKTKGILTGDAVRYLDANVQSTIVLIT